MTKRALVVAAAAVVLMAAGCGGSDGEGTPNPGGSGGIDGNVGGSGGGGTGGGTGGTGGTGGAIPEPVCGDGLVEGEEACDDGEDNSNDAPDACRTDCTEARCGDSVEDTGETCDDGNQAGGDGCSASCQLEFTCGDGLREFTEECDGEDLADQTCADFGHNSGALACATDCTFDASACATVEICGNGVDDDGDLAIDCDDTDCASDIVACPTCGDGVINVDGEDCDGTELDGATCTSLGFASGTISCSDVCILDTTGCVPFEDCATPGDEDGNGLADCEDPACSERFECPNCGNGVIQQGEQCEGAPPPQSNCQDNGFDTGTMTCDPVTCQISTVDCRDFYCGDAAVEGTEECDDGNDVAGDGCSNCVIEGDTCANPVILSALFQNPATGIWSYSGDTSTMTNDYAGVTCTSTGAEPDVIVKFTAPAAGRYTIDLITSGTPYDDKFLVWDSVCGNGSPEIGCMDTGSQTIPLTAGQEIYIVVTGYGTTATDNNGPFTLTVEPLVCGDGFITGHEFCDFGDTNDGDGCSSTCQLEDGWACDTISCRGTTCGDGTIEGTETCEDGNTVANDGCTNCKIDGDSCANPFVIDSTHRSATTGIWTFAGDTTTMTRSYVAPTCNTSNAEPEAVVKFTAPGTGDYTIDMETTGTYDDLFYVWADACGIGSPQVACKDSGSQTVSLTGGQEIFIVATGYGPLDGDSGPFTLTIDPVFICGDGVVEGSEQCDLGDIGDGDGCNSACQYEDGWTCNATSCRQTICGDGIVEGTETCDDQNTVNGDGCSACKVDGNDCTYPLIFDTTHRDPTTGSWTFTGDTSPMTRTFTAPSCNSTNAEPEAVVRFTAPFDADYTIDMETTGAYDDLFYVWDGACGVGSPEIACKDTGSQTVPLVAGQQVFIVATGWSVLDDDSGPFTLKVSTEICGDGYRFGAETCDNGDVVDGDGCSSTCQVELGWECDETTCWETTCGDGVVEGQEQCDDSNTVPGDGCSASCKWEGDTCADAYPFGVSHRDPATGLWTLQADTSEMNVDYTGTCSNSTGEPDMVVAFTAPYNGSYKIDLATTGSYDDMFYVWDGACGSGSPQLACVDSGSSTQSLAAGQQIFIVVTGYGAGSADDFGPFTLTVQEVTACGNGIITSAEACDDGNQALGDGCDDSCRVEPGFACDTTGCWPTTCGDTIVEGSEQCDDGNTVAGDGCDACATEGDTCATAPDITPLLDPTTGVWTFTGSTAGMASDFVGSCDPSGEPDVVVSFTAPTAGSYSFEYVLNGRDGLLYAMDGSCGAGATELFCSAAEGNNGREWGAVDMTANQTIFLVLGGEGTMGSDSGLFTLTITPVVCGDGVENLGETCDDGNTAPGDGCDATCTVEWGVESEPNDTIATANPLGYGISGAVDPVGNLDFFSVDLTAGVTYVFRTAAAPDGTCASISAHDTTITLRDAAGTSLGTDGDSGPGYCSHLEYEATVTGTVYLEVKGWSSSSTLVPSYYVWWSEL